MNYFYEKIEKSKLQIGKNILLNIGHFKYLRGVTSLATRTFEDGILLGKYLMAKNKTISYQILVDDIGIDPRERKILKDNFSLPKEYIIILKKYNIKKESIHIAFESVMRNKASRISFKKMQNIKKEEVDFDVANQYERCVPLSEHAKTKRETKSIVSIINPNTNVPLVLKEGTNPKCNFIIACNYFEGFKYYDSIISFYDKNVQKRIEYGGMVANLVFDIKKPIINFFYDGKNNKPTISEM